MPSLSQSFHCFAFPQLLGFPRCRCSRCQGLALGCLFHFPPFGLELVVSHGIPENLNCPRIVNLSQFVFRETHGQTKTTNLRLFLSRSFLVLPFRDPFLQCNLLLVECFLHLLLLFGHSLLLKMLMFGTLCLEILHFLPIEFCLPHGLDGIFVPKFRIRPDRWLHGRHGGLQSILIVVDQSLEVLTICLQCLPFLGYLHRFLGIIGLSGISCF